MKRIYLDHAAVTPIDKRVLKEIRKYSGAEYGNPSSIYMEGVKAKRALEEARRSAAALLRALPDEIIFTGSGTEANNLALLGSIALADAPCHVVTTNIEHASVLETLRSLEAKGKITVSYVPVENNGIVDPKKIVEAIRPVTILVSVMMVNNEIGTIQPIREIAKAIRDFAENSTCPPKPRRRREFEIRNSNGKTAKPFFHCDASQAPCYLELNVEKLGIDLLTLDSHKVYGPRGIGLLYRKRGVELSPVIHGGGQEKGIRSGTENLPAVMGFAKALEVADREREAETKRLTLLRDYTISRIKKIAPHSVLNGDPEQRIANNVNISIPGIDNEYAVLSLDAKGISVSTKSSCLRDEDASYVIRALRGPDELSRRSIRISLGRTTTKKDIDYFLKVFKNILLR